MKPEWKVVAFLVFDTVYLIQYLFNHMYITNMEEILEDIGRQFEIAEYIRQRKSISEDGAGPSASAACSNRETEGEFFIFLIESRLARWFLPSPNTLESFLWSSATSAMTYFGKIPH